MEIGVLATDDLRLFPKEARLTLHRLPVPPNELCSTFVCDKTIGVHAPTIHVAVGSWNSVASHDEHEQVQGARFLAEEVVRRGVRRRSLWDLIVGAGFEGVDEIGEENGVVDEEYWGVDTDNVFVAWSVFVFVALRGNPAYQNSPHRCKTSWPARARLWRNLCCPSRQPPWTFG